MKLRWSRHSLADLERLAAQIAQDRPMAAGKFVAELRHRAEVLERQPLLGRIGVLHDTRELVVHRNYLLTYRVRADEVHILQFWHVARDRTASG